MIPVRAALVRTSAALAAIAVLLGCSDDAGAPPPGAQSPSTTPASAPPASTGPVATTGPTVPPLPSTAAGPTVTAAPGTTAAPGPAATGDPTTPAEPATTARPSPTPLVDEWGRPVPPTSPGELVDRLVAVEARLRTGPLPGRDDLERLGHEHQVLVRTFTRHAEWSDEVAGRLDAAALARLTALAAAGTAAADTLPEPLTTVPAWRIRPPLDPAVLTQLYRAAEAATGTPWEVLAAVNLVETRMGRIVGLSSAGAQGPMQFIPATWERYGEGGDPFDDAHAIAAAARLLAASGAPDDLPAAVHAYNPSAAYVDSVLGYAGAVAADPWLYGALWGWQVYLTTEPGLQWLPAGFAAPDPTPLAEVAGRLPPPVPPPPG